MRAWEDKLRKVVPYIPGEQPMGERLVKLNTNENPYPPAPGVKKALEEMSVDAFRKYPDPTCSLLVNELARYYDLPANQVFVGVGSDDVLAMAFMAFFNSEKPILFPDVSYSFYHVWADLFHIPYETPKVDEAFFISPKDYERENGGVIFPNPNAPSGLYMPLDQVEAIIASNQDVIVIVDEAYIDFGGTSARSLMNKYENLLIVQTFSKSRSMAGMRIGFAMGHPDLIKTLHDVKYSYNSYTMNLPALILGTEAVKDDAYFKSALQKVINTRECAKKRLRELDFTFPDSMSNFIFASHRTRSASELFDALKQEHIYVRYFKQPRLDNHLRISIGSDEEMEVLYQCLEHYLG